MKYTADKGRGHQVLQQIENAIGRISSANRDVVDGLFRRLLVEGLKPNSIQTYVVAFMGLDAFAQGRPFAELTASDYEAWLYQMRQRGLQESSVYTKVSVVRRALPRLLGAENLPTEIAAALYVRTPRSPLKARLVSEDEFHRLLEATRDLGATSGRLPRTELSQALLWMLWDSGFRASELLSLNVGDVELDGHRGATLRLRPDAPDLKTGPRDVYVAAACGPLKAWLALHPAGQNPSAPLFCNFRDRTGLVRMRYKTLHGHLDALARLSGVAQGRQKSISPHDFRHTCATRKAKGGWMEEELRKYFGWTQKSHMPGRYVHLSLGDMRDRVRRDAGIEDHGYYDAMDAGDDKAAFFALLRKFLADGEPPQSRPSRRR